MGRKRIELFGEDRNIRPGWLTLGSSLSNSNFVLEKYNNYFKGDLCYPDVQGYEGGRYVGTTEEIEDLRPRSPTRQPNINPLLFTPVNPAITNLNMTSQNASGNLSMNNFNIGNNINAQNINSGINMGNLGVNPMIPMNFPFIGNPLKNQIQNITNIQRNNINNIQQNNY